MIALRTSRAQGAIDIQGPAALKGKLESMIAYPDRMAVTVDTGTLRLTQVLAGDTSWMVQNNTIVPAGAAQVRALRENLFHNQNNLVRFLLDPGSEPRLRATADGVAIDRGGLTTEVGFTSEGFIRRVVYATVGADGVPGTNRIEYEEFAERDGFVYPRTVRVWKNDVPISTIRHDAYERDAALPEDLFRAPEPAGVARGK